MLHKYQQKSLNIVDIGWGKKDENKKNLSRGLNPPRPISTHELNGAGYADWNFFVAWKYQPEPPKIVGYASQPDESDSFCHLYFSPTILVSAPS